MSFHVDEEILSQPDCWRTAAARSSQVAEHLPRDGERVAFVGCGTSWFMGQALAALREQGGRGESDAFTAAEFPLSRVGRPGGYDRVVALTRSGTTTEVLQLLRTISGRTATVAVAGDLDTPVVDAADHVVDLAFADEQSVVQTRFATSVLALFRAAWSEDVEQIAVQAEAALTQPLTPAMTDCDQITFVGQGWTVGLANEAALKFREASSSWAEAYPAMDYRHGPVSIAAPGRIVWCFGPSPDGLAEQVAATGATFVQHVQSDGLVRDAMADLVVAQRLAVARATQQGLNPDQPRNLTRSVVLA